MTGELEKLKSIQKELEKMSDSDKIKYLIYDISEDVDYMINIDNDSVYIHLGYDEYEDSIGVYFDEFGYCMILTLFQQLGLKADFV